MLNRMALGSAVVFLSGLIYLLFYVLVVVWRDGFRFLLVVPMREHACHASDAQREAARTYVKVHTVMRELRYLAHMQCFCSTLANTHGPNEGNRRIHLKRLLGSLAP